MKNNVEEMVQYLEEVVSKLDNVVTSQRGDKAFIVVPRELQAESRDKNIITYRIQRDKIKLCVWPEIKEKPYFSVAELVSDTIESKIYQKYNELLSLWGITRA